MAALASARPPARLPAFGASLSGSESIFSRRSPNFVQNGGFAVLGSTEKVLPGLASISLLDADINVRITSNSSSTN